MTYIVEYIRERHIAGFRSCLDAVAREEKYLGQTSAPPLERVEEFVRKNIETNMPQYVALCEGSVVGWCDAIPAWADALKHRADLGMGVIAAFRGRGIGKSLLAKTLEHAANIGVKRIDLEVRADNSAALRLYENMGFNIEGRRTMGLFHGGVYHETIQMGLILGASA